MKQKLEALADCTIVYATVTPIKARSEEEKIVDILNRLVQTLKGNPPPWLRKALQQKVQNFEIELKEEAKG